MKSLLLVLPFCLISVFARSQKNQFQVLLDSGKNEFKRQAAETNANYSKAYNVLSIAVKLNPDNAEARYFLGYAIDRMNSDDGTKMIFTKKELCLEASEQFEKVIKLQEVYSGETVILDPYSKIGCIWGSLGLAYLSRNQIDSARWAFQQGKARGGFIDPLLEYNRQMLNSCNKDAILITFGDNITIPSLYLQTIENFRTDITVVDASLLNAAWYPKYLKNFRNLKMGLSDVEIDTIDYISWKPTKISIINPGDTTQLFNWIMKPSYYGEYILKGDRMFLNILKSNLFIRDFYFSGVADSSYNLSLTDYIIDDGIVTRVILKKNDLTTPTTIVSKNLSVYSIDKLDTSEIKKSRDAIVVLNGFRATYMDNSYFLFTKGDFNKALTLMNNMERKFPKEKLPYLSDEYEAQALQLVDMIKRRIPKN